MLADYHLLTIIVHIKFENKFLIYYQMGNYVTFSIKVSSSNIDMHSNFSEVFKDTI